MLRYRGREEGMEVNQVWKEERVGVIQSESSQ